MTRRIAALAAALFLFPVVVGCGADPGLDDVDSDDLERYDGPGFSILLPEEPEEDRQVVPTAVGDVTVRTYVVETSNDDAVVVAVTDLPKEGATFSLDNALTGSASSYDGAVEEKKKLKVAGNPAVDARMSGKYEGDEVTFFTRLVLVKHRLVQLLYAIRDTVTKPDDVYFEIRDSLELT